MLKALTLVSLTLFMSCQNSAYDVKEKGSIHGSQVVNDKPMIDAVEKFPAVTFKKVHKAVIPFSVERVFPLFEPQGRQLLYKNWKPTLLKKGEHGSLKGQVEYSKYDALDVLLTVREYNPDKGHIQYLVVWDDFEIQRIDIYCKAIEEDNTTQLTWMEHNAGLYEKGAHLVRKFVTEGYLDKAVERYVSNIKKHLENE